MRHEPTRIRSADPLLENFFRLLQRSYLIGAKQGKGLAVYRSMAKTVHALCGEPWFQRTIFPTDTAPVRRFIAETKLAIAHPDPESVVQKSLMGHVWKAIATSILQALDRRDFASLCIVSGAEDLRAAQASGRGIVLARSHTVFAQLLETWLVHEGIVPGVTIWKWAWEKQSGEKADPRNRTLETARELHAAAETLRRGELVHILADGDKGGRGFALPFYNRQQGFRPAFAELAVNTNALVLTVDVNVAEDGSIAVRIGKPFVESAPDDHRAKRIWRMTRLYAQHLHRQWQAHPADLPGFVMARHLRLPSLTSSDFNLA